MSTGSGLFSSFGRKARGKPVMETTNEVPPPKTSKGPVLFSNFGKKTGDILIKDYSTEQKISVSSESVNGVAIASTVVKKGGLSGGDVAARYQYKKATVDAKVDMDSNVAATFTLTDILPSTKTIATLRYPDYTAAKFEAQYLHEHASFTAGVDLNKAPSVDVSATIGTPFIAFGTEASYKVDSRAFTKYSAGVSLTKPNYGASAILTDKGDSVKASCFYHPYQQEGAVLVGEIARKFSTNDNTLTLGGSYAVDPHTVVKAKLNNHGHLSTLVQRELAPKSFLILSGAFDSFAMQKSPRLGLALSLRP